MKKLRFLLGLASLFTSFSVLSSCKKSYSCCYGGVCNTVSKTSSESESTFKAYIKYLRGQGYTCK